jgi:hypothetical protein
MNLFRVKNSVANQENNDSIRSLIDVFDNYKQIN